MVLVSKFFILVSPCIVNNEPLDARLMTGKGLIVITILNFVPLFSCDLA